MELNVNTSVVIITELQFDMFWYINKQDNTPEIFGSVSAICAKTGLKEDVLYYHFSRLKRAEFENEKYRIVKCKVVRALRS